MRLCGLCLLALVSVVIGLGPVDCGAVVSLGVTPPILEVSVPAGEDSVMELKVYNGGGEGLRIAAYASAIKLGPDGTPIPLETAKGKWSCAEWITLDRERFELLHGEQAVVHATLSVPGDASGGRYAVILFEAAPSVADPGPADMAVGTRVGSIILETVPRTLVRSGKIKTVEVSRQAADSVDFGVDFLNTGNVHVKARGSILIKDNQGHVVDRVPLEVGTGTVLPDGVRTFRGTWSNASRMEKGDYTGEVRVICPGMGAVRDTVRFSIE